MKKLKWLSILSFVFVMMLFGLTSVYAEVAESTQYTITIDANGGIEGKDFKSTIVLGEEENYAVSGYNEDFLKAPEGKGFAAIELIDKNGEVIGLADSVLLWGDDFYDNMTLKFYWGDPVSDINLNFEYPKASESTDTPIEEYGYYDVDQQTNKPSVTINSEYGFEISFTEWVNIDSYEEEYEYYSEPYIGTFESGKIYYALVDLFTGDNKEFSFADADSLNITVNGEKAKVYKIVAYSTSVSLTLEVTVQGYEVIEGADQVVTVGEEAEFEIDADYGLFEDGGEVYVDDNETPLELNVDYTARPGSTIIKLSDVFLKTLSIGEHALKVVFGDGNIATTSFTIADNGVEVNPPKTGLGNPATIDNIMFYIVMLLVSVVGFSGIIIFKKRFN